jgi:hypothetical protein
MAGRKGGKKKTAATAPATTSGDAGNSAPPSTGGRPPPRQRGEASSVQEGERSVEQARADEAAATALMVGSSDSQLSGESDLTAAEARAGAEFLRTVKRKLGEVSTTNLGRVMSHGLLGALNHDSYTALPTSAVRSAGQSPAPDVQITGHSKPVPEPSNEAAIAAAAAAFISSRGAFADTGAPYASYPAAAATCECRVVPVSTRQ